MIDGCDFDDDGDGVQDSSDACPGRARGVVVDGTGCPAIEPDPVNANTGQTDTDGDGPGDACDSLTDNFAGFYAPVDNLPTVNSVKAGSAVPLKFSLGGYRGMAIFASGSPASVKITCGSTALVDALEETATPGASTLSYDASTDRYSYVWKTTKDMAGTCRQVVIKTADGGVHRANFLLKYACASAGPAR